MPLALHESKHDECTTWLQEYYENLPEVEFGRKTELHSLRDAYLFGKRFSQNMQLPYEVVESQMMEVWEDLIGPDTLPWEDAQPVIEHAFNNHSAEVWTTI